MIMKWTTMGKRYLQKTKMIMWKKCYGIGIFNIYDIEDADDEDEIKEIENEVQNLLNIMRKEINYSFNDIKETGDSEEEKEVKHEMEVVVMNKQLHMKYWQYVTQEQQQHL